MEIKSRKISIGAQVAALKRIFPGAVVRNIRDQELIWQHRIRPSPLSDEYAVKLHYKIGERPKFYVTDPKPLALAKYASELPHCYDQETQRLCLYFPDGKEWNASMPLAKTIVWWGFEWLYHYELWLKTDDVWMGGGVHPFQNHAKIEHENKSE